MVAKISTGSSMFGALAYNQEKVDNGEAKVLFSNKMLLDEDGHSSIGGCMRSFEMQMPVHLRPFVHQEADSSYFHKPAPGRRAFGQPTF